MQALILAGGEGTRLRPLTSTIPKPLVPLAGKPLIVYMLEWLRRHGIDEVVLACGFMADDVRARLGDGAAFGLRLRYMEEPRPLGTAGALKFAQDLLRERFLMLNGDVLSDIDIGAQLRQHEATGARATLALVEVPDPSAYGLVRLGEDRSVLSFLEKPDRREGSGAGNGAGGPNLINAGAYVLERDILEHLAPAGTASSIEHDVFPRLVGNGLFGYPADGYWLDVGTPQLYLKGTFDLLDGTAPESVRPSAEIEDSDAVAPSLVGEGATIGEGATVGPYAVLGPDVIVGKGARIERTVVLEGASVGAGATLAGAIVGPRARVGEHCQLKRDVVVGEGAVVEAGGVLAPGARIFPGVVVSEEAMR